MAGRNLFRGRRRGGRNWVAILTEALILAVAALVVILILRPGPDAARAEAESGGLDANRLEGVGRVIDGDTLDIGAVRVRLHGIDAFEWNQVCDTGQGTWACGAAATSALRSQAQGRRLVCRVLDTDRYGRKVSRCERDGVDVARVLVADGLALAYRRYSRDYVGEETAARARAAGAWDGSFDRPEQWRSRAERERTIGGKTAPA